MQQPQQQPQQPQQRQQPQQPPIQAAPTTEEVQQAAERTIARTGRLPQLPANTHEHINNIAASKDDGELVGRTIQMLIYFAEFEDWRGFTEQLLGFVRDGNKSEAAKFLTAFFDGMAAIHLIDPTLGRKAVRAVMENFDTIRGQMKDFPLQTDEKITGDVLLTPTEESANAASS